MYDQTYVEQGINVLARAHELNYFADGHRGAAMVAAYYLCREYKIPTTAGDHIANRVKELWIQPGQFAQFPEEADDPALLENITKVMMDHISGLRQAGHNVILPTLALKAFHDFPQLVTSARVKGICALIAMFTVQVTVPVNVIEDFPDFTDTAAAASFILQEFFACGERFDGRGQGWTGHLLTYGKALFDLRELGYIDLARQAEDGFRLYIERIRSGPQATDKVWAEHAALQVSPLEDAYWLNQQGDWGLGHVLKYPYGFYGLLKYVKDTSLIEKCMAAAYRIF